MLQMRISVNAQPMDAGKNQAEITPSAKTLTVFCRQGLSNRLRVLTSGMALAEDGARRFKMLWPITPDCAVPYADLFANPLSVETVDAAAVAGLPSISGWPAQFPDLRSDQAQDVVIGYVSWLFAPAFAERDTPLIERSAAIFADLAPIPSISARVTQFRNDHFRPTMIGVHLRRGDMRILRPDTVNNALLAMAAVDRYLAQFPDAGILLCTDDGAVNQRNGHKTRHEGIREQFVRRYGARVVWPAPRSLDRREPLAIQDAVADLWLLRATDAMVGTAGSSFSDMAAFGRNAPYLAVGSATPGYRILEKVLRISGLLTLVMHHDGQAWDASTPLPVTLRRLVRSPFRRLLRIVAKWR